MVQTKTTSALSTGTLTVPLAVSHISLWRKGGKWLRRRLGPWIGIHEQYSPRPLTLPDHYARTERLNPRPAELISIVTPSFNQGRFLERTIQSVLSQQYSPLEFIVQDGGSMDETGKVLEKYHSQLHHVESAKDRGQAHAINLGFRHAAGVILAYLNSDDVLLPGALNYVASFFGRHPEVDVIYGHRIIINTRDEEVGRWILPPHRDSALAWNDYIPQETMFWRRRIWDKIGGQFQEDLHSALDWDLLFRFRQAGARFVRVPRFLGAFRIHPQQKSDARLWDLGIPEQNQLRTKYHGRLVSRLETWCRVLPYLGNSILYHRLFQMGLLRY